MELGDRMKGYEYVTRTYLPNRMPIIIRLDGRAFHTFTRNFNKPFDKPFMGVMQKVTAKLVEEIPGCVFGYTQSDEISLLLKNDQTNNTEPWFKNNISKIVSISASMATLYFNRKFDEAIVEYVEDFGKDSTISVYMKAIEKGALFDSRVFVIPEDEIVNYFIWRQQDATRNSIQMVGQANFSHKELQYLKTNVIQDKLFTEKDINWNDYPVPCKRGTAIYKIDKTISDEAKSKVKIDKNIPIFTEDRDFVISRYKILEDKINEEKY